MLTSYLVLKEALYNRITTICITHNRSLSWALPKLTADQIQILLNLHDRSLALYEDLM
ncbi:MAG: hypothetical protein RI984_1280, partial [Pseudomonadota bacterium]